MERLVRRDRRDFQFESLGMRRFAAVKAKQNLKTLGLNAIYRTGPIDGGMIEDFIRDIAARKVRYYPEMRYPINLRRLGFRNRSCVAQKLAGYSSERRNEPEQWAKRSEKTWQG